MPWVRIKEFINNGSNSGSNSNNNGGSSNNSSNSYNMIIFHEINVSSILAPVLTNDIVYYKGTCTVKAGSQDILPKTPTTITSDGYLTLENGTLEYGWLKTH